MSSAALGPSCCPPGHATQRGHHPPTTQLGELGLPPHSRQQAVPPSLPCLPCFPRLALLLFYFPEASLTPLLPAPVRMCLLRSLPALPSPLPAETSISSQPARCCSSRSLNPNDLLAHTRQPHGQPWDRQPWDQCHGRRERPSPWHPASSPQPPSDPSFLLPPSLKITERKGNREKRLGEGA